MEFSPQNAVVKLCIQGMVAEESGNADKASDFFSQAWQEAKNDFEKYLAAFYLARHQKNVSDKLMWLESSLTLVTGINDNSVKSAFYSLYSAIAQCYVELSDSENVKRYTDLANDHKDKIYDRGPFYHGTKADLQMGDLLTPGGQSNYQAELVMNHIYFTALPNGAGLAAELAKGDSEPRVYLVEPTGEFENDPNVTDKKFPGNPTRSYRSNHPLKIVGEIYDWVRLTPEELQKWREKLGNNKGEIIN